MQFSSTRANVTAPLAESASDVSCGERLLLEAEFANREVRFGSLPAQF
jgi:hypothetical protein